MATLNNDDRDQRPRLIYKSYSGKKGPEFEPWVVGFLDAAEGKGAAKLYVVSSSSDERSDNCAGVL